MALWITFWWLLFVKSNCTFYKKLFNTDTIMLRAMTALPVVHYEILESAGKYMFIHIGRNSAT